MLTRLLITSKLLRMNKKYSLSFVLLSLLTIIFTACSSDKGVSLPNYFMGYATVLRQGPISNELSIRLDDGIVYPLDTSRVQMNLNTLDSLRVICYYTQESSESTSSQRSNSDIEVITLASVAPVQLPEIAVDGTTYRDDPISFVSMSKGTYYLNLLFEISKKEKDHLFYVRTLIKQYDTSGKIHIAIRLYHDSNGDYAAYSSRVYMSIPLYSVWDDLQDGGSVNIQYTDEDGVVRYHELTF